MTARGLTRGPLKEPVARPRWPAADVRAASSGAAAPRKRVLALGRAHARSRRSARPASRRRPVSQVR